MKCRYMYNTDIYIYFPVKIAFHTKPEKRCAIVTQGIVTNGGIGKRYEMKLLYLLHYFSYLTVR